MPRFPQRKFLLALGFIGWSLAGIGCAPRHIETPVPAAPVKSNEPEPPPRITRSLPAPPPELKPTTPRTFEFTPPPARPPDGWTYRKPPAVRPTLSLFEEAVLLGQVRGALKKLPEGAEVVSSKIKNRTTLLAVTPRIDTAGAKQIGERLLEIPSLDEVRISPEK